MSGMLMILLLSGCATKSIKKTSPFQSRTSMQINLKIDSDLRTLRSLSEQLDETRLELIDLHKNAHWKKRGYFNAAEQNQIERLYFHFVVGHTALWDIINSYGGPETPFPDSELGIKAHTLILYAEFLLAYHTSFLVAEFADDPVAVAKLNENFYRSEIARGTYDLLYRNMTDKDSANRLTAAWTLYSQHLSDPDSGTAGLIAKDRAYGLLVEQIPDLYSNTRTQMQRVFSLKAGSSAKVKNYFSHLRVAELTREASQKFGDAVYGARALLFKNVSRLKSPTAHLAKFSDSQKKQVYGLLQPGDIILTYTAGYMSDIFIPGEFKHGITYVGSPSQRRRAGLSAESIPDADSDKKNSFAAHIDQEYLPGGVKADMIEAVAEGVIFNNLARIMDTHINRMLILRPRLSNKERTEFLAGVFSWLGDPYDFRFDFADASRQVCTEVIYRALNRKGGINFSLTKMAGHEVLSADDIVRYYTKTGKEQFSLVLFVETNPGTKDHEAIILTGPEAEDRINDLMAAATR